MTCATCGIELPKLELCCRNCINRKARDELLGQQRELVPDIKSGRMPLRLARTTRTGRAHLVLLRDVSGRQSYCGVPLDNHREKTNDNYSETLRSSICSDCLQVFDAVVASVMQVEPGAAG